MKSHRGILCGILAAALFGLSTPASKSLLSDLPPQLLAGLLYLGSGLGLLGVNLVAKRSHKDRRINGHDLPWLGGAIFFGGVLAPILLMLGLSQIDAAAAALLLNLESVFTTLIAWFVFRENFDGRILLGMLAIVGGCLVLSAGDLTNAFEGGISSGSLLIAAACLCWGVDNNLTRKISTSDPYFLAMLKGLMAGMINVGLASRGSLSHIPELAPVAQALLVGFIGYGLSLVLFIYGLRYLGASRAGAYFATAPLFGALASLSLGQSKLDLALAGAAVLMGLGLWLHLTEVHIHDHIHEEDEHEHSHSHDEHHRHEHAEDVPPGEPHTHWHTHDRLVHRHRHFPDADHRHTH